MATHCWLVDFVVLQKPLDDCTFPLLNSGVVVDPVTKNLLYRIVDKIGVYLFCDKNYALAANNYGDRTLERYPNRIVPHLKIFERPVANLKDFGFL